MAGRDFHPLHTLFQFLDRMNTSMFEVEVIVDFPEEYSPYQHYGTLIQTKSIFTVRNIDTIERLLNDIRSSSHVSTITFTNTILSGSIDFTKKTVNIIFHTIENIENILHQLIDIPIPTFELNLKLLHTGMRRVSIQS